ncbi:unnamed protein product [Microthlaspi erraticum]|uniref:Uncharacterized protein n=1 Tax=Microthlaspi erraticum TaxID=1685480 RepID=A0A6D2L0U6_9BRAS|nr:unnamed protein product [Microthlaspi erraticum]
MSSVHVAYSVLLLFLLLHLCDSRHLDKVHIKDQKVVSGPTSKEPARVSLFVPDEKKNHHRRPPLFVADYPKPSTRPPRHN